MLLYNLNFNKFVFKRIQKAISVVILTAFISTSVKSPAYAQVDPMPFMPSPGVMVHLSPEFTPAYLKGIVIHPENALKFDFIINKGDKYLTDAQKKEEYTKLTKYFLASLAIPDDDQWVNLSPYEKDRIIKDDFGKTEMGRDLLAQDYMLKQITASLIYPEDNLGKKFWDTVYSKAQQQFGTTNIPVNTFNKVWILPDDALIYEKGNTAYVLKNHLRVMLEEDYLSLKKHAGIESVPINRTHTIASKVVKEIVLPELEREVNEDQNFATVRQVYSGMLLAAWYKRALKESLLSRIYANKAKVKGVDQNPQTNEAIYRQYLKAYKKGVFNFIKEDVDKYTNETIPRKYFSGGFEAYGKGNQVLHGNIPVTHDLTPDQSAAMISEANNQDDLVQVAAKEVGNMYDEVWMPPVREEALNLLDKAKQENRVPNILFVCSANVNRSILGEIILKDFVKKYNLNVTVNSAGTREWGPNSKWVKKVLQETFYSDTYKKYDRLNKIFNFVPFFSRSLKKYSGVNEAKAYYGRIEKLLLFIATGNQEYLEREGALKVKFTIGNVEKAFFLFDADEVRNKILQISETRKDPSKFVNNYITALYVISDKFKDIEKRLSSKIPHSSNPTIKEIALENGIDVKIVNSIRSKIISPSAVNKADLIIVADRSNKDFINDNFSDAIKKKVFLFKAFDPKANPFRLNFDDPQLNQITEAEAFKQSKELIQDHVLPLILEFKGDDLAMIGRTRFAILLSTFFSVAGILNSCQGSQVSRKIDTIKADTLRIDSPKKDLEKQEKKILNSRPSDKALYWDVKKDKAQVNGGIDFNAANLNLQIKRDGNGVPLPISQQDMDNINIDGLEPIITDIRPATGLPMFSQLQHAA